MNNSNIKVGDRFMDLTPGQNRTVEILEINGFKAKAINLETKKITMLSISRIRETEGGRGWRAVDK